MKRPALALALRLARSTVSARTTCRKCCSAHRGVSFLRPDRHLVDREFTPGMCAYQQILAHEMRNLKAHLDYLPKVEVGGAGPARHAFKSEMSKGELLQAAIDNPRDQARLGKVGQGEVQSLIGSAKRTRS